MRIMNRYKITTILLIITLLINFIFDTVYIIKTPITDSKNPRSSQQFMCELLIDYLKKYFRAILIAILIFKEIVGLF